MRDTDGKLLYDEIFDVKDSLHRKRKINLMIYHRYGGSFEICYTFPDANPSLVCLYHPEKSERDAMRRIRGLLKRIEKGIAQIGNIHITDLSLEKR